MKKVTLIILVGFCISCKHLSTDFVQNGLRIVSPATQAIGENGEIVEQAFNDGGTKKIRITDAIGQTLDVYFDHRFGKEANWGAIYINNYPESPGSIRIINVSKFKKCFLHGLKY